MNYILGIFSIIAMANCNDNNDTILVSVIYETLCPYSSDYIVKQVYPTWLSLDGEFRLELIPYGLAEYEIKNGNLEFKCHHGSAECYANKIQACILRNKTLAMNEKLELINCLMKNDNPDIDLDKCTSELGITQSKKDSIEKCIESKIGDLFLLMEGVRTESLRENLSFVPLTMFDEIYNIDNNRAARKNLKETICRLSKKKPAKCLD